MVQQMAVEPYVDGKIPNSLSTASIKPIWS
jgi:hypothetical protein